MHSATARLLADLESRYAGEAQPDPILRAFASVTRATNIPKAYPLELVLGMRMDAESTHYRSWDDLLLYCYRVAGTVGLMMCHLLGVSHERARRRAAHLGIAMQLTNIARDVAEDWERGRLYLPDELLAKHGAGGLSEALGRPLPRGALPALSRTVKVLLAEADHYYRSADVGISELDPRSAWAVDTARAVYSDIGRVIASRGYAIDAGRARVSTVRKLYLAARAGVRRLGWARGSTTFRAARLEAPLRFPDDIVPI
jgi:phytoene synthase